MIDYQPSMDTYRLLKVSYSSSLKCPCSQATMRYNKFLNLSAVFHQVCSSDLLRDSWIDLLIKTRTSDTVTEAWFNEASRYFRYLSTLCDLADKQIHDGIESFLGRTMATINVLNDVEFHAQLNSTVKQFIESIVIEFRLFMETSNSFMQVDQPLNQQGKRQLLYNYNYTLSGNINRSPPEVIS